jgi:RNA polymerase sigma factor (sigma-70 family)
MGERDKPSSGAAKTEGEVPTDEQLMATYAGGDQEAFRELFARYAPLLAGVVRAHVFSEDESRDFVQQVFLQLHRARRDYRPGEPLRPWLFTIAYNLIRDRWRAQGRRREVALEQATPPVEATTPADQLQERRRAESLRAALARLPDDQRVVVELHWFAGLPLSEVAATLGVSLSAAKVRAHRAYQRLRADLHEKV